MVIENQEIIDIRYYEIMDLLLLGSCKWMKIVKEINYHVGIIDGLDPNKRCICISD